MPSKKKSSRAIKTTDGAQIFVYALVVVIMFALGFLTKSLFFNKTPQSPVSLVWTSQENVKAPADLVEFLDKEGKKACDDYMGNGTPRGVSLNAVDKVVQNRFARVYIGCSTHLSEAGPAVKEDGKWILYSGARFYVTPPDSNDVDRPDNGYARCSIVDKHRISKDLIDSCIDDKDRESNKTSMKDLRQNIHP